MAPAQQNKSGSVNFRIVDWMRGFAALGVVTNHARGNLFSTAEDYAREILPRAKWNVFDWADIMAMQQTNVGVEFVILFFVLSGFSIAHSLEKNVDIKAFYFKRLLRLYPPYLMGIGWALLMFWILSLLVPQIYYHSAENHPAFVAFFYKFTDLKTMLRNCLYAPKDNALTVQYWSLSFEVIFYLLAPFIIRKLRWAGVIALGLYALSFWNFGITHFDTNEDSVLANFFFNFNIYFLLGIVLYKKRDFLFQKFPLNKWTSLAALLILFEFMVISKAYLFNQENNKITSLAMALFATIMLIGGLKYAVRIKPLEWVGKFSYTLYLTHMASLFLLKIWAYKHGFHFYLISQPFVWIFGVAAAVAVSYALYYVAEFPSIQFLKSIRKKEARGENILQQEELFITPQPALIRQKQTFFLKKQKRN